MLEQQKEDSPTPDFKFHELLETSERAVREKTFSSHQSELETLHTMLQCFGEAFRQVQGTSVSTADDPRRYVWLLLVMRSVHALRAAEVLLTNGYYGECASLMRNIFEDWLVAWDCKANTQTASVVLKASDRVRLNFSEIADHFDKEVGNPEGKTRQEYQELSTFAHPKFRALRMQFDPDTKLLRVTPEYDRGHFLGLIHDLLLNAARMTEFLAYILGKEKAQAFEPIVLPIYERVQATQTRIREQLKPLMEQ